MSVPDITMAILSHHPVQLLATTVLLVHLARAIFRGPAGERKSEPAWPALGVSLGAPTGCSSR